MCYSKVLVLIQLFEIVCLTLFNFFLQEKESWDMNVEEKIEAAGKKKEEGNALFKAGKYVRASKRYEKVNLFEETNINENNSPYIV